MQAAIVNSQTLEEVARLEQVILPCYLDEYQLFSSFISPGQSEYFLLRKKKSCFFFFLACFIVIKVTILIIIVFIWANQALKLGQLPTDLNINKSEDVTNKETAKEDERVTYVENEVNDGHTESEQKNDNPAEMEQVLATVSSKYCN